MTFKLGTGDRATSRLVERQMRNWELARAQRYRERQHPAAEVEEFLCISRMAGVDHEAVTAPLGERLGWPVFDRELLDAMAGDDAMRRQIYRSMDQRDLGWWESTVRGLMQGDYVRNDYFHRLCETVLSLARQGSCVFVGRGADLVLPAHLGLRVRLVAPFETRLAAWTAARGIDAGAARREIERVERQRAAFIQGHFGIEAGDPVRPDLTVNLGRIGSAAAVELILEARRLCGRRPASTPAPA